MADNEKKKGKSLQDYAKDAESEEMAFIEKMLEDSGIDIDALEGDDEGQDGES
jgi:hypothetical protein